MALNKTQSPYFTKAKKYTFNFNKIPQAVSWLRRLGAGLSPRRPGSIHVGFAVDKVALGQIFLRVIRFSPVNIIPPLLHMHLSPPHEVCDSSDQAAHYHHLGPKLGALFLTGTKGWKQSKKVKKIPQFYPVSMVIAKVTVKGKLILYVI
jgi:hypothetical protein